MNCLKQITITFILCMSCFAFYAADNEPKLITIRIDSSEFQLELPQERKVEIPRVKIPISPKEFERSIVDHIQQSEKTIAKHIEGGKMITLILMLIILAVVISNCILININKSED